MLHSVRLILANNRLGCTCLQKHSKVCVAYGPNKLEYLSLAGRPFQPILMFVSKAGACLIALPGGPRLGRLLFLPANIRLVLKRLSDTNTLD
jgi:hypothetical protein